MLDKVPHANPARFTGSSRGRSRRRFLHEASGFLLGGSIFGSRAFAEDGDSGSAVPASKERLIDTVERRVAIARRGNKELWGWFHPYACVLPTPAGPMGLMTMQSLSKGGDHFGPLHFSTSTDLGRSWSKPEPVPGMGRHPVGGGVEMGFCDLVPQYHPQSDTVVALGHNVYYKNDELEGLKGPYWPVYTVRDAAGNWSTPQKLVWDDPRAARAYGCGCSQWTILPDGDVLVPLWFNDKSSAGDGRTKIIVASPSFDGQNVRIRRVGNAVACQSSGLAEPSLAALDGRHYLTLRAQDGRGYMTTSPDGLHWEPIRPWAWEDGTPLDMSNTQQHWLTHSEGLFLVYTRKTPYNEKVRRWRAPLLASMVDRKTMRLIRDTEITVLPIVGDGVNAPEEVALMGNFSVTNASPDESWVTVGENMGYYRNPEYHRSRNWVRDYAGDLLLARICWARKNDLVSVR